MFPFWQIPHSFFIIQNTSSFIMTRIEENTLTRPIILIHGPVTNQGLLLIKTKKQNKTKYNDKKAFYPQPIVLIYHKDYMIYHQYPKKTKDFGQLLRSILNGTNPK